MHGNIDRQTVHWRKQSLLQTSLIVLLDQAANASFNFGWAGILGSGSRIPYEKVYLSIDSQLYLLGNADLMHE